MKNRNIGSLALSFCLMLGWQAAPAVGQIVVPGADGSDGVLTVVAGTTYVIDLSLAPTGTWDGINASPGNGVYDPAMFAVVFRYSSVNIPAGTTMLFKNHPTRAPVVWLVGGDVIIDPDAGNVTITGTVDVGAVSFPGSGPGESGPGGFRGGTGNPASGSIGAGFGPGGGPIIAGGGKHGSYASLAANESTTYGNARILPLVGGSGGAAIGGSTGSGGGGAILIAATGMIALDGSNTGIFAHSSDANGRTGSGGAIRLIANNVTTAGGLLRAQGGHGGGDGRISIEAVTTSLVNPGNPNANLIPLASGDTAQIWPDAMTVPTVRAVSLGASLVPSDPQASLDFPMADIKISDPSALTLTIEAQNVPVPGDPLPWNVNVRVVPKNGQDFIVPATFVSGDQMTSTWTAQLSPLPNGFSAIQVRASAN